MAGGGAIFGRYLLLVYILREVCINESYRLYCNISAPAPDLRYYLIMQLAHVGQIPSSPRHDQLG